MKLNRLTMIPFSLGVRVLLPLALVALLSTPASAAPAWIYRGITLPGGDVAVDMGLGIARAPVTPTASVTGYGLNLGLSAGVTSDFELGFRTGLRFEANRRYLQADRYGRTWDNETYRFGDDPVANPELHMRWLLVHGGSAQLGLELRAYLPTDEGTYFGILLGMPLMFRVGALRVDTGVYVPMVFAEPDNWSAVSIPFHLWLQATSSLWLGPLLGIRIVDTGPGGNYEEYPLGFGLGLGLSSAVDFRSWFLFPQIRGSGRTWGTGFALQVRFE